MNRNKIKLNITLIALAAAAVMTLTALTAGASRVSAAESAGTGTAVSTDSAVSSSQTPADSKTEDTAVSKTKEAASKTEKTDASKTEDAAAESKESPTKAGEKESSASEKYTLDNIRDYIVGLDEPVELEDGTKAPLVNFDNAATTPAFKPVMDEVDSKLSMYGSIGRGFSQKSNYSPDLYNETRQKVLDFVSADAEHYTCFYVNNTTDGLNKLASALIESKDDLVLATRIEHHANDLSWRERCKVIYAEVDDQGRVIYDDIESC